MRIIIILLCLTLTQVACNDCYFNFMNPENPRLKSFKYYTKSFDTSTIGNLSISRDYIHIHGDTDSSITVLSFFSDGFLNEHFTRLPNTFKHGKSYSGTGMGYYKVVKDSVFFTTKIFYDKRPVRYQGRIKGNGDTLDLEVKYPRRKEYQKEIYILE